jgi:hypothetical protein
LTDFAFFSGGGFSNPVIRRILPVQAALKSAPAITRDNMTSINAQELMAVGHLPDEAVLTKAQTLALMNLSEDTLKRLHRRGEGPVRIQLSPLRVGYSVGAVKAWLKDRSITAA